MIVTDKKYYMDNYYLSKLDLMIKRMAGTDDTILIIDGDEGQGKTELTVGTCYYVAYKTGRKYDVNNIFFELDKGIEYAGKTSEQIIHLDEGALGLLSTQWWSKNQQKFLQLVMIARKKKHFIAVCIPKFYKLNQYIIEERSIGLVHVYSDKNLHKGRFCYYSKNAKERLYQDWRRKRFKNYGKFYTFHGKFVKAINKVFTPEQEKEYETKKDKAIMDITKSDTLKNEKIIEKDVVVKVYKKLRKNMPNITVKEWAKGLGVTERTIVRYNATEIKESLRENEEKDTEDTQL